MKSLFFKEVSGFFSSITGYVVIVIFLIVNGLFMWVFPGELNVLDAGYSSMDTLFTIAPWIFMFLLPAVTMRSFSEEKKTGTIDMIFTRPVSENQIVLAKYLAGLTVAVMSIIPTLIFYYSVYKLGIPGMKIDTGATWGSYIGLVFLAAVYCGIGIFASSLTDNMIVAFLLAVILCFFIYIGFNSLGYLSLRGNTGNFIVNLGIDAHYKSMRRGVIDSRDVIYFISVILLFHLFTVTKLKSRNW
ncbi:MAG: gliding motility-associated ABC transporter permease subunit GldF [Bacteroidales bacterium]|nr:gliding motility-associated ABC transporter permease subunit GldF [Bacteroidales bacterium]